MLTVGWLWVGNASLVDVSALYGLEQVNSNMFVLNNPLLGDDTAQQLVDEIGSVGGVVTIDGNQ